MSAGERLVIKKNTEEKTSARSEVLEEADGRHAQVPRGMSEPDEGQTGHNAGADKKQGKRPMAPDRKSKRLPCDRLSK